MKLIPVVLFFLLVLFIQPAYAWRCGTCQDSTGKFIGGTCLDGTPVPSCPPVIFESTANNERSVTIVNNPGNGNTNSVATIHAPTQPPTIVTVVVTPTTLPTVIYKVIYRTVTPTLSPMQEPTATPSATKIPTPTRKLDVKPSQQKHTFFKSIAHFFQNILHFIHLG